MLRSRSSAILSLGSEVVEKDVVFRVWARVLDRGVVEASPGVGQAFLAGLSFYGSPDFGLGIGVCCLELVWTRAQNPTKGTQ